MKVSGRLHECFRLVPSQFSVSCENNSRKSRREEKEAKEREGGGKGEWRQMRVKVRRGGEGRDRRGEGGSELLKHRDSPIYNSYSLGSYYISFPF